jgi:hypothetical protein
MNEVAMLSKAGPREILQTLIEKKTLAVLSFLSKGKWHVAKAFLTSLGDDKLDAQLLPRKTSSILRDSNQMPASKPQPINIQVNQPVGISLKYGYGKFIFETTVVAIQSSNEPTTCGTISFMVPERIEMIQRRSYFRVEVPSSLKVNVMLWHCHAEDVSKTQQAKSQPTDARHIPKEHYWSGKLTDISAGGVRIIIDAAKKPDFRKGQFVGLRFTPMPYETPLMFDAQIRNVMPTACENGICLGMRIVGLEASPEGRQVLQRLCSVAEHYHQINQCTLSGQDFQITSLPDQKPAD